MHPARVSGRAGEGGVIVITISVIRCYVSFDGGKRVEGRRKFGAVCIGRGFNGESAAE